MFKLFWCRKGGLRMLDRQAGVRKSTKFMDRCNLNIRVKQGQAASNETGTEPVEVWLMAGDVDGAKICIRRALTGNLLKRKRKQVHDDVTMIRMRRPAPRSQPWSHTIIIFFNGAVLEQLRPEICDKNAANV